VGASGKKERTRADYRPHHSHPHPPNQRPVSWDTCSACHTCSTVRMRLPYRNKKVTLWVLFGIIVITMFLFKFTELRPTCLFKVDASNELSSQMVRVEVCTPKSNTICLPHTPHPSSFPFPIRGEKKKKKHT